MADGMSDVQNTMNGKSLQVSASTFMPSQGKLACGRTDGSIILVPAVETIVLHLLDGGQELGQSPIMVHFQRERHSVGCMDAMAMMSVSQ